MSLRTYYVCAMWLFACLLLEHIKKDNVRWCTDVAAVAADDDDDDDDDDVNRSGGDNTDDDDDDFDDDDDDDSNENVQYVCVYVFWLERHGPGVGSDQATAAWQGVAWSRRWCIVVHVQRMP